MWFQGYVPGKARMHYSGPLMPPGGNVEEMLRQHERQIQEAVRKARIDKTQHKPWLTWAVQTQKKCSRTVEELKLDFSWMSKKELASNQGTFMLFTTKNQKDRTWLYGIIVDSEIHLWYKLCQQSSPLCGRMSLVGCLHLLLWNSICIVKGTDRSKPLYIQGLIIIYNEMFNSLSVRDYNLIWY